jgi:type IV secretion system protein VirB10
MILDLSGGPNAQAAPVAPANPANPSQASSPAVGPVTQTLLPLPARPNEPLTADERFAQRLGVQDTGEPARATRMTNLGATVQQGAVITAVLETAINSDLPGFARAVVSREVRSFDGATVLVPQGSHVIGQYRSGVALGQSRVFVVWTRLIRPDGVSIELGSAGTDDLGRGGLEGDVERHFFQRFGGALLLSLVGVGGQAVSDRNTQVVVNSTQAGTGAAAAAVQQEVNISPTIDVPAGTPLRIFVARDLDFSAVEEGH